MLTTINNKNNSKRKEPVAKIFTRTIAIATLALTTNGIASAQTVTQSLDSTFMHSSDKAAELAFNDPALREPGQREYIDLGIRGADLRACQLTAFDGLFCLDGKDIRTWPTPSYLDDGAAEPESFEFVSCTDGTLGLDTRKSDTCTGMTVDFEGNLWLAGKNKGKTHSLIKIVPLEEINGEAACPADEFGTKLGVLEGNVNYCAFEFATGRPLLVDIAPVDGALAQGFALPGYPAPRQAIIGLEERKAAVAFLSTGEVVEFASGKQFWGLAGPEQLMGITLLQLQAVAEGAPLQNIILVTTSFGRILAYDTSGTGPVIEAFDFAKQREESAELCTAATPSYSVRSSRRTQMVFASDSGYCEVLALEPSLVQGKFSGLVNVQENGVNLTLSTRQPVDPVSFEPFAVPLGVTVAAGNSVNLKGCGEGKTCSIAPGASLGDVKLSEMSRSGLTIFKIDGIPDCRYVPVKCLKLLGISDGTGMSDADALGVLEAPDVGVISSLLNPPDFENKAAMRLNVTPMMPTEVTELFPEGMPDLWLPRYLRGQESSGFIFGGIFGRTQDGVLFRDTFEGEYDVALLAGEYLGCDFQPDDFLAWDVAATVSERYVSAPDSGSLVHIATILNSDCGSTRTRDGNFSFKPYNLELTPCTYNPAASDTWWSGGCNPGLGDGGPDDAVYAKLIHVLMDELLATVQELACKDAGGENGGIAPLSPGECLQIESRVLNAADKYEKCWNATLQPKQSSGDQNCEAFNSQLASLYDDLGAILYDASGNWQYQGNDVANRIGELRARTVRLQHILETRFLPSLPDEGFYEPNQ